MDLFKIILKIAFISLARLYRFLKIGPMLKQNKRIIKVALLTLNAINSLYQNLEFTVKITCNNYVIILGV